jgi:hypothetical protein
MGYGGDFKITIFFAVSERNSLLPGRGRKWIWCRGVWQCMGLSRNENRFSRLLYQTCYGITLSRNIYPQMIVGVGNEKARFEWSGLFFEDIYLRGEDCAGVLLCLRSAWSISTPFSSISSRPARMPFTVGDALKSGKIPMR